MTASSLEFFPCRVQLMGLPSSFAGATPHGSISQINDGSVTSSSSTHRSQPLGEVTISSLPVAKLNRINRNLFGTPNRMEMNELYQEEIQRQRSYVMQRYNFDINMTKHIGTKNSSKEQKEHLHQHRPYQSTGSATTQNLIEQELQQHEERLQKEKCNLIRPVATTTVFNKQQPTMTYNNSAEKVNLHDSKVMCYHNKNSSIYSTCSKDPLATPAQALPSERYKPYERQVLITDCFSLRKSLSCGMSCGNKAATSTIIKSNIDAKISNKQRTISSLSLQQNFDILKAATSTSLISETSSIINSNIKGDGTIIITDNEQSNNNSIIIANGYNKTNNDNNNENVIDIYKSICISSHKEDHHDRYPEAVIKMSETLLNKLAVPPLPTSAVANLSVKAMKYNPILNKNDYSKNIVTVCRKSDIEVHTENVKRCNAT